MHAAPANTRRELSLCPTVCSDSVDVVAMGVDGYLIVPWADTTRLVMTPPAYSNPTLWHLALRDWWWGTRPNRDRIAQRLHANTEAQPARLANVRAVLVGHGHYDHLMDLPPLFPYLSNATVYGNSTVVRALYPTQRMPAPPLVDVTATVGRSSTAPGADIVVGPRVRVRPIAWAHAPNIGGWTIASGHYDANRSTLPRTVHGWRMGEPLAWTVDVLDSHGGVVLRLFHHDAAATLSVVRNALAAIATMPSAAHTVVILSAANWDQANAYPSALLASLEPDQVIFGHWEDFFRSPTKRPKVVRGIRAAELIATVEKFVGPRWTVLEPGSTVRVRLGR
jgi:hypothetical protein